MITVDFLYVKLSQVSVLFPLIAGAMHFKKLNNLFKMLWWFFVLSLGVEITAACFKMKYHNNLPVLHFFTLVEMSFLSIVYFVASEAKVFKVAVAANLLLFWGIAYMDAFTVHDIWMHNSLSRPYESTSLSIYSLFYFYFIMKNNFEFYLWKSPMFWVNLAVLVYFSFNILNFTLNNYFILHAESVSEISLYTHALFNIIAHSLFAQSFRCFKTRQVK